MIEKDYNNEKISKKWKKIKISPKMKNEKQKQKKNRKIHEKKDDLTACKIQNPTFTVVFHRF